MVMQGTVPEIGNDNFRVVEPVVDRLVVADAAPPFAEAGPSVMIGMRNLIIAPPPRACGERWNV
jgi:hypothetical protein